MRASYPDGKLTSREVVAGGATFTEHLLTYHLDGRDKRVVFVPMPTTQAVLGAGSVSCLTLLSSDGKTVVMVPPTHFQLSLGLNPAEDEAVRGGGVDRALALAEYEHQKARFEAYGVAVHEVAASARLHEQIYTRDTGYFLRRDVAGRAWDSVFRPEKAGAGAAVFVQGTLELPARRGEVGAIRRALAL